MTTDDLRNVLELARHAFGGDLQNGLEDKTSCCDGKLGGPLDFLFSSNTFQAVHGFANEHATSCSILQGVLQCISEISTVPQLNELVGEIQALQKRRGAVSLLLDAIEHEAETIEQQLQAKEGHRKSLLSSSGAVAGIALQCCGLNGENEEEWYDDHDDQKSGLLSNSSRGKFVELLSNCRKHLTDSENRLVEREGELRALQAEVFVLGQEAVRAQIENSFLRASRSGRHDTCKDAAPVSDLAGAQRHASSDPILDLGHHQLIQRKAEHRKRVLASYGAFFKRAGRVCVRVVFLGWQQLTRQRRRLDKTFKHGARALVANGRSRILGLFFSTWRALCHMKREAHKRMQRRTAMTFACLAASALMRALLIEWWRHMRREHAEVHILHAQREAGKAAALARERELDDTELFQLGKELQHLRHQGAGTNDLVRAVDLFMGEFKSRLQIGRAHV